jgi:serine protease inhibitor
MKMKKIAILMAALVGFAALPALAQPIDLIPPYHWSYRSLESLSKKEIIKEDIIPGKTALTPKQIVPLVVEAINTVERDPAIMEKEELQALRQLINGYEQEIDEAGYSVKSLKRDLENYAILSGQTAHAPSEDGLQEPVRLSKKASDAINEFTFKLYKAIAEKGEENLTLSPYSVSSALAMVYAGASGETEAEMAKVLSFDAEISRSMAALIKETNNVPKDVATIKTANALWPAKGFKLVPQYVETIRRYYNAPLHQLDYTYKTEKSRLKINDWVSTNTGNRIKDMIPRGLLDSDTKLVLTNAIYFKALWDKSFSPSNTSARVFTCADGTEVPTMMMRKKEHGVGYIWNEEVEGVSIPYRDGRFAMKIFMPNKNSKRTLKQLESELTLKKANEWFEEMKPNKVKITMPKFKMEGSYSMSDVLKGMGMAAAFSNEADLSGISEKTKLHIDEVLHKTFIEVAEKGTEAAAATAVIVKMTTAMPPMEEEFVVFEADRPFIYMITDESTGAILFVGRYMKP